METSPEESVVVDLDMNSNETTFYEEVLNYPVLPLATDKTNLSFKIIAKAPAESTVDLTGVNSDFASTSTNEVVYNGRESEYDKIFKVDGQKPKNEELQFHDHNSLQDITNSSNQNSSRSLKRFLSWLDHDQLNQSGKRRKLKVKMPSVVSGAEWQRIKQEKEDEKLAKAKEMELKRKIKIEKQDEIKIKKELDRIKREEQKWQKEQLRFEKEKEKLLKQQKRLNDLEEKKKATEELLLKKKEEAQIKESIESLLKKQEEFK